MKEIAGFIWEILGNFIESVIYIRLLMSCQLLRERWKEHKKALLFCAAGMETLIISVCNFLYVDAIVILFLCMVVHLGFSFVFLCTDFSEKLFVSCLPVLIVILSDHLTFTIGAFLFPEKPDTLLFGGDHHIYATLLELFLCYFLADVFGKLFQHKLYIPHRLRILLVVALFLSVISTNLFLEVLMEVEEWEHIGSIKMKVTLISMIFSVVLFMMFFMIQQVGQIYHNNFELERKLQEDTYDKKQLDFLVQSVKHLRIWKHDYCNNLIALNGLLQQKDYEGMKAYLKTLQEEQQSSFLIVSTGNPVVDAIVTNKYNIAKQYRIKFEHKILMPKEFMLKDTEITAVLGNLLDNAVNACIELKKNHVEKPKICLVMKPYRDMYCIQVINTSGGNYCFDSPNRLLSSKKEKKYHGNGLLRVSEIVEHAGGFLQILPEQALFRVKIVLPMEEKGKHE